MNYQSTGYTGASISKSSSSHSSHNHNHNHNSLASKGLLSNTFFSNVPMVNARKKIVRRESTQLLFSDSIAGEDQEHDQPYLSNEQQKRSHQHQYGHAGDEKKDKEKNKNKSKDNKALILLPAGQWKKGEAVLKSNGQLVISSGVSSNLFRIDICSY